MTGSASLSHFQCACGRTEFEARGRPIATLACYCNDCQAAGRAFAALPGAHSGVAADGGMVSSIFRKDRVQCIRGRELLQDHKLRPESHTIRAVASCCNSNIWTRFDNQTPIVALRTFGQTKRTPQMCVYTKHAPDSSKIAHTAPRYESVPAKLIFKIIVATLALKWASRAKQA